MSASHADAPGGVLIITAIELEYQAVLAVEQGAVPGSLWEERKDPNGLPFAVRHFLPEGHAGGPIRFAVICAADMGDVAATNAILPLAQVLRPACLAMCGVCAGRPGKTALGDVVVADKLYFHDGGKLVGSLGPDGKPIETVQQDLTTYQLRSDWKRAIERIRPRDRFGEAAWLRQRPSPLEWQEIQVLSWLSEHPGERPSKQWLSKNCPQWKAVLDLLWKDRACGTSNEEHPLVEDGTLNLTQEGKAFIDRFRLLNLDGVPDLGPQGTELPFNWHVGSFASGDQVVEDQAIWTFITASMRKTLGLDMEAAALGAVAHYQRSLNVDAIVMKGVMDFANHGRDDHFKDFAARASAECLILFLRENLAVDAQPGFHDVLGRGTLPLPPDPTPSQLLDARYEVVPWRNQNREDLLRELELWSNGGSRPVSVRLLYGDGGVGKTRLGIEWVNRRALCADKAGFLLLRPPSNWLERLFTQGAPLAIVIDYAESRSDTLQILEQLGNYAQVQGPKRRIRVLLLARNADVWWTSIKRRGHLIEWMLDEHPALHVGPLHTSVSEREATLQDAIEVFSTFLGAQRPETPPDLNLSDPSFERALYVHMAALSAVQGEPVHRTGLIEKILNHEERFWANRGKATEDINDGEFDIGIARQIIGAATLRGGLETRVDALKQLGALLDRPLDRSDHKLIELLHQIYHNANGEYIPSLEPDLLGEAIIVRLVRSLGGDKVSAEWISKIFFEDDSLETLRRGLTVVARASVHNGTELRPWLACLFSSQLETRAVIALQVAKAVGKETILSMFGDLLADQLEARGTEELARSLDQEGIPTATVSLRRVGEWVERVLLSVLPLTDRLDDRVSRARRLNLWGNRLYFLGQLVESKNAAKESVRLWRELAQIDKNAFLPELAGCLLNLATRSSDSNLRREATLASLESVRLFRLLAFKEESLFGPHLADALANLAIRFHEGGRYRAAYIRITEAIRVYSKAVGTGRFEFMPSLGNSFNTLSAIFAKQKLAEKALGAAELSVEVFREAMRREHDAYLPDLTMCLNNLGNRLIEADRNEEAVKPLQEAVEHCRVLVRLAPMYEPRLSQMLGNLGTCLAELERIDGATLAFEESIAYSSRLALDEPAIYSSKHAMNMNNFGVFLRSCGRYSEALQAATESVERYRECVKANRRVHLPDLAKCTLNLAALLGVLGDFEESRKLSSEAVDAYREIAEHNSAYLPELASSLKNLCTALLHLGSTTLAHDAAVEAQSIQAVLEIGSTSTQGSDVAAPDRAQGSRGSGRSGRSQNKATGERAGRRPAARSRGPSRRRRRSISS